MFKKYQQIHFVGIGGIGMSGIAEVLLNLDYRVTGSDLKSSDTTKRLKRRGAKIFKGHDGKNVEGAHVIVVSSAVHDDNPEVIEAYKSGIAVVPRAEMLAELMRLKYSVAVAGTHGKTSTTSLIGCIIDAAGLDPTLIIGGKVNGMGTNARLGKGEFLVAEADESDRSFLKLSPTIGVITNIDPEHMENYQDFADVQRAYIEFANKVPFYGAVVACSSHPIVRKILKKISRPCITYGHDGADYTAQNIESIGECTSFEVIFRGDSLGKVEFSMVGSHYIQNALAAIAVARHLDISMPVIKRALASFKGVNRRFTMLAKDGPFVVDDYAHHPVEIAATISAARQGWPKNRIVAVMQPHRYSRLAYLFDDFISSLKDADAIVVMEVYPAGEKLIRPYTGEKLWRELCERYPKKMVAFAPTEDAVMQTLMPWCRTEDVILFLGAGSVTATAKSFAKNLISRSCPRGSEPGSKEVRKKRRG